MRMQDNWDSPRTPAGGISDQYVQHQDERKAVQKRTFTRWMNVFLQRRDPPVEVHNLFTDIQDGRILMALLEELSGCKLLYRFRSSTHRIFRLNNISKALAFLDDRHVKLLGIDASGIADGIPSVVLNLVWNIVLHFQVKEVMGGLQRHLSSSLSSLPSSLSSLSVSCYPSSVDLSPQPNDTGSYSCKTLPSKGRKAARESRYHGKAINTLLQWVQRCTSKHGVDVHDFGKSWRSGLAFLAMIKSINPNLVDLRESLTREPKENMQQAFRIAHHRLDIPPLLEPEDVTCTSPDEQSIITYVSMFLGHHSDIDEDHTTVPEIPNFGSLESVSFGETLADDPEAQALLKGLEKSSEQVLWKRWSRRSLGSPRAMLPHTNGTATSNLFSSRSDQSINKQSVESAATSTSNKKKGRGRSVFQPPSPLDARIVSQEIQSWMETGLDQGYGKQRVHENRFSLSSEEGIYSLTALDSDEEDAYSYILDLNKEVFQPFNHLKKQIVTKVDEETAEEMNEESKHLEACKTLNGSGCKPQEGHVAQSADFDLESEVGAQSVIHRKSDLDKNESTLREMTNTRAVFDLEPEADSRSKEESEEERVVRGQNKHGGNYCEEEREAKENVGWLKDGYDKTDDNAVKAKMSEAASKQQDVKEGGERELSEKCGLVSERRTVQKEDEGENITRFDEGWDLGNKREAVKEEQKGNQQSMSSESLKVGVNENILNDEAANEVRRTEVTRITTEEESNRRHSAVKMDLTKNCKDDEEMENTYKVIKSTDFESVKTTDGKNRVLEIKRLKDPSTTIDHSGETTTKNDADGGVDSRDGDNTRTPARCAASQYSSEGGFILQSLPASCDISPLELKMLLVLWLLLYCCLILPQMNL